MSGMRAAVLKYNECAHIIHLRSVLVLGFKRTAETLLEQRKACLQVPMHSVGPLHGNIPSHDYAQDVAIIKCAQL